MLKSKITGTDLTAAKIVLGSDAFGTDMTESESFQMLDVYAEAGGNIVDTASVYQNWLGLGEHMSEKTIGKWLVSRGMRDKMIVVTKGGHFDIPTNTPRLTYECVRYDFEKSLENLKTDCIDIYYLHKDNTDIDSTELVDMLNSVAGKNARYLGVSNWSYDRIKTANDYAKAHGLKPIIASQMRHTIAKPNCADDGIFSMTESEYEKYAADTLNVFAFSAQAKGFFALLDIGGIECLSDWARKDYLNNYNLSMYERIKAVANEHGTNVSAVVLAALIADDKVNTFAQIGPRKLDQLISSLSDSDLELTATERKFIIGE